MNVRERAKNYEAFMSKSSSMEREKKRSREEGIEASGSGMGDKKKMAEEGKTKPVPPPRKKKPLEKAERSPQLQHRSTFSMEVKSPPVVHPRPSKPLPSSDTEKPKITKKPPPRPTPYRQPSSPSLDTKVPQPRHLPKRPPVARPTPTTASPGGPKTSTKEIPKRPPPPSKTSSLPRKPKPPIPPKPSRPVRPVIGEARKKSATLPKTGSLRPEYKNEDNVEIVETKAERSLTGPHRISVQNNDEMGETEKAVDKITKNIGNEGKGTLHLDIEKPEENVIEETVDNAEFEEGKEPQELSENASLAKDLTENGEISNGVSQEDKHNRTLNEEILKDDKEPETVLEEDILDNTDEKMVLDKNDIVRSEELPRENRTEIDNDVTMDKHSEKFGDAQNEDEAKEEENEPSQSEKFGDVQNEDEAKEEENEPSQSEKFGNVQNKDEAKEEENEPSQSEKFGDAQNEDEAKEEENEPSQSVSLENMENLSDDELCEKIPVAGDLSLTVEEKTLEVPEEKTTNTTEDGEVITNGHLEDEFVNSQSNENTTRLTQTTEHLEESTPIDMIVEDSTEKNVGINDEIKISSASLVDRTACQEEEANCVDEPLERKEVQQVVEAVVYDEDKSQLREETAVDEETSGGQDGSEVISGLEEQLDVQQKEETQQLEADEVLEAIPKEPEQPTDEEKHDQDDSVQGVEILDEDEREETKDVEENATMKDEQCKDGIKTESVKEELEEETLADTLQQNESKLQGFNEASLEQSSDVTAEENLLQEEMRETSAEEKVPEQTDETQRGMEEMEGVTTETEQSCVLISDQDVPVNNDSEKLVFTVVNSRDKDTKMGIEDQAKTEENGKEEILENVSRIQGTISSKTEKVDQENDPFSLDEPIRPRRPSRLKKLAKNNIKETETIITSKPLVKSQIEESCKEEEPRSKPVGAYESVVLNVSSKEGLSEPLQDSEPRVTEKPSSGYENVILPSEEDKSQESGSPAIKEGLSEPLQDSEQRVTEKPSSGYENVILPSEEDKSQESGSPATKEDLSEPLQDSEQRVTEKPSSGYENVILPSEEDKIPESGSLSIYEVPRRSSFHSHTSEDKMVRKTRSSSIGSLERNSESEYQVPKPRSRTVADQTYVVPRSSRLSTASSENDETYVVPKAAIRATSPPQASPVFESEYHVPQSLVREESTEAEYQVPPRARSITGSEEEEGVYSVPKSPRESRTEHPFGSEEEEGVYSVPKSVSVPRETHVETRRVRHSSECDEEAVYSVPSTPVANESEPSSDVKLPEEGGLRRSSRSSVLTSRTQLPLSFKHAPPKPPRKSISGESKSEDKDDTRAQEDEVSKPVPIPRVIPQPKPRHMQAESSPENKEEQLPAPSPPKDKSKSSPKPKRPAPPRPKAPGVSPLIDKENEVTVTAEVKNHSAPPRPPPPYVNRTSFAPSEPESVSSTTGLQSESSESESEEEKPSEPTGPPKKKTCFIAHEILSTEKTFVNALTLCYEDCYGLIRNADVVPESILNDIFKDLGNIYHLDSKFLQELEERMKTWDEHERIGDIVKKYGHFLKMYTTYINNYDKAMNVLQETTKENPQFAELVYQFQASEKCKGLFLISFMLKPVQRIPSYRLLLKDYLKHLPPDSVEFKDIKVALDIVSEVATHINESMKKADNFERVLRIQESLVGNAEIVKPGRNLIKEGVLKKLCRKDMQERIFFLLTDVLLYTAPVGNTQYKLKEKLPLLGMKVTLPESPDFENEFNIISKMRSFTLSASTSAERDEWIDQLRNAINALADKKKTFLKPKDGTVADTEVEEESKLGEKAPVWIPDARVTMCMLCTDNFTVTNRRHHCRGCGKVVCGSCSDNLAPLAYLDYVQARVCEVCYDFLLKEQNKSESNTDFERLPASPLGMTNEDLDRIHRKPPKFEILHRFKPGNRSHARRKSRVVGRPSVCTEVVGHDSGSQMSGYLKFKRTNRHGWKRLWFVLKDNVLYTYKASEDVVAIETIPILGYVVQEATRTEDEIQFQLKHAGLPPITFKTESESSVSRWIQELKKATTL